MAMSDETSVASWVIDLLPPRGLYMLALKPPQPDLKAAEVRFY